jgi:UDP-N-acetylmuramoylalanine--D-glutamate ligase
MKKTTENWEKEICGKRVAVLGMGVSNTPVIDMLLRCGAIVTVYDKKNREKLGVSADKLEALGVRFILGDSYLDQIHADIIFRSPGIRPDVPSIQKAISEGAKLTSEMEEFFDLCPCKIIAVTGSDGKTTTTTLISEFLKAEGYTVHLGGNIGKPLLPEVDTISEKDYAVVELSSFQLQTMKKSPNIAVITNVTPNHLNWHTDMEEYIQAKLNILKYQSADSRAVLNDENSVTHNAQSLVRGECFCFNAKNGIQNAEEKKSVLKVFEKEGQIYVGDTPVLKCSTIRIPGHHNVENYMAAIAATWGLISIENIQKVAAEFGGVEHRIEFVRELDGVKYYNSSIDSSPTRTIAALNAFSQKLIVLTGGYDKKIPYEPIGTPLCEKAKIVIYTGATGEKIRSAITQSPLYQEGNPNLIAADDYGQAVSIAYKMAQKGDIVLLSPASASFDAFVNFEERGRFFKKKVMEL